MRVAGEVSGARPVVAAEAAAVEVAASATETAASPAVETAASAAPGRRGLRREERYRDARQDQTDLSHHQTSFGAHGAAGAGASGRANFIFGAFWAGNEVKSSAVSVGFTCQSENSIS